MVVANLHPTYSLDFILAFVIVQCAIYYVDYHQITNNFVSAVWTELGKEAVNHMIVKEYAKLMRLELKFFLLDSSVRYIISSIVHILNCILLSYIKWNMCMQTVELKLGTNIIDY